MKMISNAFVFCLFALFFTSFSTSAADLQSNHVVTKSPLDERVFKYITLKNNLRVLLVSDAKAHMSAAALVVNVGLYDDPKAFPGMAHFLEHMLFLGTKKFPDVDEYPHFIQSHGGHFNAMTQEEKTTYFFNIEPKNFQGGLERFSEFFITPLFKKELVDRELNAVDSEFHLTLHKDNRAAFEIHNETSNPSHPAASYFMGNMQTLGYDKPRLYQDVVKFFRQHYFAKNMTLALVGPQSINELNQLAEQYFSKIVPSSATTSQAQKRPLVFTKNETAQTISMKGKGQERELSFTFPITSEKTHTRQKTGQLISYVLGYEGKGSLSSILKEKGWINSLGAFYHSLSNEQDALTLHLSLTKPGLAQIEDITQYIFNYITLIKQQGISNDIIEELKTINENSFLYMDQKASTTVALEFAQAMHEYEPSRLIVQSAWMKEDRFSSNEFSFILGCLTPENLRRFIISPQAKGEKISKRYQATYDLQKLTEKQKQFYSTLINQNQFQMPTKNPYLPTKLSLQKANSHIANPQSPQKYDLNGVTLWHHQDKQFNKPKSDIFINFVSDFTMKTPKNAMLVNIFAAMINDVLMENFYQAQLAGASIALFEHSRGLGIVLQGYSENQEKLLTQVLNEVHQFKFDNAKFSSMQDKIKNQLMNFEQLTLLEKANISLNQWLMDPYWHPYELLEAIKTITSADLKQFLPSFWSNCQIEMLVHGSYNQQAAVQLAQGVKQAFTVKAIKSTDILTTKIAKLGHETITHRQVDSSDQNQVALWYVQNDLNDVTTIAKTLLLGKLLETPFYQQLRVEQQLGYSLGAKASVMNKVSGLLFYIQSPQTSSQILLTKMSEFLQGTKEKLMLLSEKEIETHRTALIHQLRQPPKTIEELTLKWWRPIQSGEYDFDYEVKLAKALEQITVKELIRFALPYVEAKLSKGQIVVLSRSKEDKSRIPQTATEQKAREFFKSQQT